jgi:dihydrofolate synthase/folylpolyglutamate synthase
MFFLWAAETPVDAMVVEVGLGGRWDATNVVPSKVAVITNVGLDHTGLLGMDRETIAKEKSGIAKPGVALVTGERTPSVLDMIEGEVAAVGAELDRIDKDFAVTWNRIAVGGRLLSISTSARNYEELFLPLHGAHQGTNAALALEATLRFVNKPLDEDVVNAGLGRARSPGRLETVRLEGDAAVPVLLDAAHNPDGMAALVNGLVEAFAFERAIFVVGILDDKDYGGMLSELARVPASIIATQPVSVRAVPVADLVLAAQERGLDCVGVEDVPGAVDAALAAAAETDLVCITGSHYVVGEARTHLLGEV